MLPSLAALVFIGATAAAGVYVGTRPTVINGEVMAADLLVQLRKKGVAKLTCDELIPVTPAGAVFRCHAFGTDGSTAHLEYTMNREGGYSATVLEATRPRPAPGADSWGGN